MIFGHGSIGQFPIAAALAGTVVNAGTHDVTLGQGVTFSIGTETVTGSASVSQSGTDLVGTFSLGTEVATGGANVSPSGDDLSATFSIGDETAFGEAFQNLITFSTGEPDFFIWSATDDTETSTWSDVEPGSTD